jgi:hypothetical protein
MEREHTIFSFPSDLSLGLATQSQGGNLHFSLSLREKGGKKGAG